MSRRDSLIEELRKIFVTWEIFNLKMAPLEKVIYGFISLVLLSVATAIIALVLRK